MGIYVQFFRMTAILSINLLYKMNKIKLKVLEKMFSKCGDGVFIMKLNDNDRWRICRGLSGRVNWVKCKEILNKKGIIYVEGHNGYGMRVGRCIDFDINVYC